MTIQEESRLSFYSKIADISTHENVTLVQHRETLQVFVRKELDVYDKDIYNFLMQNPCQFFPKIFECVESENTLILIEEYIQGKNLENYLEEKSCLSEDEAIIIMQYLCQALALLHGLPTPIIHRDLKPSNILLANDGRILLIDFNAARNFDDEKENDTVIIGTRKYAAPEQYGYAQTDARTDIYALGVILNRMLTGEYPSGEVYPGRLGEIIKKCIQFDPAARYQTVQELSDDLLRGDPTPAAKIVKSRHPVRFPFLPPGFRTMVWWKIIIAVIGYAVLWIFGLSLSVTNSDGTPVTSLDLWVNRAVFIAIGMLWIFFWFDYGGIHRYLPLMNRRWLKLLGYMLYTLLIWLALLAALMVWESVFA